MPRFCSVLIMVLVALPVAGCGSSDRPADLPELHPTTVKVTLDGEPLDGATVTLAPQSSKWSATGTTDEQGVATMLTNGRYEGVVEGEYKVGVNKLSKPTSDAPAADLSYEEAQKLYMEQQKEIKSLVPEGYTVASRSPLELEVGPGQENAFRFDLSTADAPVLDLGN